MQSLHESIIEIASRDAVCDTSQQIVNAVGQYPLTDRMELTSNSNGSCIATHFEGSQDSVITHLASLTAVDRQFVVMIWPSSSPQ